MRKRIVWVWLSLTSACFSWSAAWSDEPSMSEIPTGQIITPTAANGAIFQDLNPEIVDAPSLRAGRAAAVAVAPDGKSLAILTSGSAPRYGNDLKAIAQEYLFLFDISQHSPRELQVVQLPHTYQGLVWGPSADRLFVSGGSDDDVLEVSKNLSGFAVSRTFSLGHKTCVGFDNATKHFKNLSVCGPVAAGIAVNPDGSRLLVANLENDSVSLIDLVNGQLLAEQDLRPGMVDHSRRGQPGGSFPRSVVWTSRDHAYVASERDREIISLNISRNQLRVARRIPVSGQPVALIANRAGSRLYVALSTTGRIAICDTLRDVVIETVNAAVPSALAASIKTSSGANTNALALTPTESTLLATNGGANSLAIIRLSNRAKGNVHSTQAVARSSDADDDETTARSETIGLIPTGWYPAGVAVSQDGSTWYIVNGKSETGSNIGWCKNVDAAFGRCVPDSVSVPIPYSANGVAALEPAGEQVYQLEKAGFLTIPAPGPIELARLTKQVARNNHLDEPRKTEADERLFSFLRQHIKHVIYIIKENRTYDQVLGDLEVGNGDRRLTLFPEAISPNHHALARQFVTLDNFMVSGEGSWEGWDWSVSAQTSDYRERMMAGGMNSEQTGLNRNINLRLATSKERNAEQPSSPTDPDILPSERDVTSPDGPDGEEGTGHLWDIALRQGLTLRNWGFFGQNRAFRTPSDQYIRNPYAQHTPVFVATKSALAAYSDPYYLDFDTAFPDFWRIQEWKREFEEFQEKQTAPDLMLIRLGNDHFGNFNSAIDGVNTPETQMADNDYAFGQIVEAVANSPFSKDTLIISIEDDAWDGPDHVDAHRSIAFFAGPYVRQHVLVSTRYTTVSVVRTIEEILGMGPIGLNDALAAPMADIFDPNQANWSYKAIVPDVLRSTKLPLPQADHASIEYPRHTAAYWTKVMADQDFSGPDRVEPISFNRALWRGLRGDAPYPAERSDADLQEDRARLTDATRSGGS